MLEIRRYQLKDAEAWNEFVQSSKNGTFLFDRKYMDYHSDRFKDGSLMIFRRDKLYALLPMNYAGNTAYSHQGLTYGGLICNEKSTAAEVIEVFQMINSLLKDQGISHVVYKPTPWIYHSLPSEEDLYALHNICHARLTVRNISSVLTNRCKIPIYRIRKCGIKKAKNKNIYIGESQNLEEFWNILTENLLNKYNVRPVHSLKEITMLKQRFPNNIRLFVATKEQKMLAGTLLYIDKNVVHTQYISASEEGKELHALDLLLKGLSDEFLKDYEYFDFGTSNEQNGTYLNKQLIFQKEGFGGRAVCYDTYEWDL